MANLENNNDKEDKKSIAENIGDSVQKSVDSVQDSVKETVKGATNLASDAIKHPVQTAKEFGEQAAKDVTSYKWWAKLLLVIFWTVLFLVISFVVVVSLPATKNWAAQKVITKLNKDLNANMSFESVDVNYFGDIHIHKVAVKDYKNFQFLKAKELYADSDWFSIISNSRNLQFQSLSLDELDLKVITYKGDSISNFIRFVDLFNGPAPAVPRDPFQLKSRVYITNSKVSIINQNSEGEAGKWLDAQNVNLIVPELKVVGSDVSAQINNMRFTTERWGKKHFVDTFSADFKLNHKALSLQDLTINTDHSLLQGDVRFLLNDGSWSDFANKVKWDMQLKQGSQISGYDISYFVTDWDNYKPINISGKMTGPLNGFKLDDFLIRNPLVNIKTKAMKISNILKGNFLIETNTLAADFTYKDLKAMMPTFISSKMKNFADDFGRLKYAGSARVTPKQVFVPKANLITGIGQAKITNFYLEDYSTDLPKYRGFAEVNDLNTSVISKSKEVGLVSGKFNVDGRSFDVNTMVIRTRSQISKIEITDKVINNVYLEGILDHKKYNGIINVNDDQAKANVKGLIDFSTSKLYADVKANVDYLNINYFTGATGTQAVSGIVDGKVSMTNINDLTLDADLQNINFAANNQRFNIPTANVKAFFENGNRVVSVDAPGAVKGQISGKFNLGDLVGMVENGFGKILVGPPPRKLYRGQNFTMDFDIKQSLVNYFMPELQLPKGAKVDGSFDGNSNNLILNVDAELLKYVMTKKQEITDADKALAIANPAYSVKERDQISKDSAMVDQLMIRINTANIEEQIFAKIDRVEYNQNILKDITISGNNENNSILHIATKFKLGSPEEEIKEEMKEYAINLNQSTNSAGDFVFRFEPTTVTVNDVAWSVDTNPVLDHSITYRKKAGDFLIQNLRLYSDKSELFLKDATFKSAKDFSADGEVRNLDVAKVFALIKNKNDMDINGIANGKFDIKMDKNNLEPLIDVNITDIFMNGKEMGKIEIMTKNSSIANVFDVDVKVISTGMLLGNNNLHLTGTINNNTPSPSVDLLAKMNEFDLAFAQQFVEGIFSNIRGKASGDLRIAGQLKDIDYSGDIALSKFGLKLDFTGVDYSFDDTVVSLSRGLAILNDIGVKDGRSNSRGSISGAIQFETLSSMGVNLVMRADNLLLLNTTQKDYDLFWGRVYGNGTVYVDGPVSGLSISTPEMKALANSVFTFNSNSTSNVEEFKMLRFLTRDDSGAITTEVKKRSGANMNVDFNLEVDKGTTVNVLVGDDIGDISVRGISERLRFTMGRTGAIAMNGNYIVDNGTFVSKAILNRTFQISKGSSIRWDGDAIAPQLNIDATYLRTVTNAGQYLNLGSLQPINVVLSTKITQTLNNPKIELGVSAQDVSSSLKETLAEKMSNEDEKIIQFGSILVLNSFNDTNSGFDINIGNFAESSGYNILFKQLGSVLNTISNEFQVDLNYLKGDAGSNTGDRANASLSFALSPRITVKTGLGIPISKSENAGSDYLSGEGIVEYDWSKKNDGTRLLRGYSKPTNIGLNGAASGNAGANQSYGVGVVYSKSFNTIFKRKKKNKIQNRKEQLIKTDSIKKVLKN